MSHLRTFVANQVLSRIRAFLGVFCPDFYSDIEDFTQILCRYLSKISAAGTSASKSLGLTKLMVRSGMPVSFTEQSMYPWISVETVLPDLSMIASTLRLESG